MRSAVVAELRQAIEDTVQGNLDKSNSKLFGMGYTSVRPRSQKIISEINIGIEILGGTAYKAVLFDVIYKSSLKKCSK